MAERTSPATRAERLIPLLLGIAGFLAVVGPRVLYPSNIGWLRQGDSATHYLGWEFFRNTGWSFPLGLNPRYGLELSNAVVYSDSNPLLAIPFKLLGPILPEPFQYFGLWLFACFVLQSWFGWKIVGLATSDRALRVLGAAFFIFAPPMIWRLDGHISHLSLVGHFFIVAGLYLVLCPVLPRRGLAWGGLLATAALVHAYLLAMVMLLWLTDLAGRSLKARPSAPGVLIEVAGLGAMLGVLLWQAGYFTVGKGAISVGYGVFRMNLLAPLDPGRPDYGMWSYLLPDLPGDGQHEGFNYLGLGFILLLLCALTAVVRGRAGLAGLPRQRPVLLAALAGLTAFACSNWIGVGSWNFEIPLHDSLRHAANLFRASGRMFWPVFYALLFAAIFIVVRGYRPIVATALLGAALVVQLVDTSAGWLPIRSALMAEPESVWPTPMQNPFWAEAATRYRRIRWLPPDHESPNWAPLAAYAVRHGLATDAVYLGRVDTRALETARTRALAMLGAGTYDADTLYVLDPDVAGLAAASVDRRHDLLATVDGFMVLAPGWKQARGP